FGNVSKRVTEYKQIFHPSRPDCICQGCTVITRYSTVNANNRYGAGPGPAAVEPGQESAMAYSQCGRTIAVMAIVGLLLISMVTAATAVTPDQIKERGYIRIAVANEVPYGYMTDEGEAKGFGPETAIPVLKAMGFTDIQWSVMPFGQLIHAVNAG